MSLVLKALVTKATGTHSS